MNRKIAYTGILLALNIIILLLVNIIPMNTLFLMGIASLLISIVILEYGVKLGFVFYIASSILSFILLANKTQWILYVFTFGVYGLVKYFIERDRSFYIEIGLKLCFANMVMLAVCFILKSIVVIPINIYTILVFQPIFLVYDYIYTLFIEYYEEKLRKMINFK